MCSHVLVRIARSLTLNHGFEYIFIFYDLSVMVLYNFYILSFICYVLYFMYRSTYVDATHIISMASRHDTFINIESLSGHSFLAVIMGFEPTTSRKSWRLSVSCLNRLAISHFIQFIITEFIKYKILIYFS